MYYLYVLRSEKDRTYYIGVTYDLKKRFNQHNNGQNIATKAKVPWLLIYYEAYQTKALALDREKKL